jgi:redox-regulated HSP33 family molecular chaperone
MFSQLFWRERIGGQLRVRGDGPLGGVLAVADGTGRVRGYCGNPEALAPPFVLLRLMLFFVGGSSGIIVVVVHVISMGRFRQYCQSCFLYFHFKMG